jgi:hypothetical protein
MESAGLSGHAPQARCHGERFVAVLCRTTGRMSAVPTMIPPARIRKLLEQKPFRPIHFSLLDRSMDQCAWACGILLDRSAGVRESTSTELPHCSEMTCVLRCRFFPAGASFLETLPFSLRRSAYARQSTRLTSSLLGRRDLATLVRPREICPPSLEEPFLADGSPGDNQRTERAQGPLPEAPSQIVDLDATADLTCLK